MALDTQEQLLVEARVANEKPNTAVAYLLWFFVGIFSAHRFYLGKPGTAILQILSYFILIGVIWWIIDAFLMPSMIEKKTSEIRARISNEIALSSQGSGHG